MPIWRFGRGREVHPEVWEGSGGSSGGPGGVGRPTQGTGGIGRPTQRSWRPTQRSKRGLKAYFEVQEGS